MYIMFFASFSSWSFFSHSQDFSVWRFDDCDHQPRLLWSAESCGRFASAAFCFLFLVFCFLRIRTVREAALAVFVYNVHVAHVG